MGISTYWWAMRNRWARGEKAKRRAAAAIKARSLLVRKACRKCVLSRRALRNNRSFCTIMAQQTTDASANANSTNTCTIVPKLATKGMRPCRPFAESGVISLNFLVDVADNWPGRQLLAMCFPGAASWCPQCGATAGHKIATYCNMLSNFLHSILISRAGLRAAHWD